jgi:hypothetical protein
MTMGRNGPEQPDRNRLRQDVEQRLRESAAFRQLDPPAQAQLADALTTINGFLGDYGVAQGGPFAGQLAPADLADRLRRRDGTAPATPGAAATVPAGQPAAGAPAAGGGTGAVGRVGEATRATLNAIDFPAFVASIIQGTFQAIVDSSIQQMEAYAELLRNVAGTVDQFMADNVTDAQARDFLADQYPGSFQRDTSAGQPRLLLNSDQPEEETPSFFKDLGFDSMQDVDDAAVEEVIVPATRRTMAERRQQTLATMVLMGINRIVVDDGEIMAKLQFHIDASEATQLRFDQTKTSAGNMARGGHSPFTANGIMVNTTSLNAQSDLNVRADLTGQVKVRFRSETFPLERFADSMAIQLINQNAQVPQAAPVAAPAAAAPAALPAPVPAVPPAVAPVPPAPAPVPPPGTGAQSLGGADPWLPRSDG